MRHVRLSGALLLALMPSLAFAAGTSPVDPGTGNGLALGLAALGVTAIGLLAVLAVLARFPRLGMLTSLGLAAVVVAMPAFAQTGGPVETWLDRLITIGTAVIVALIPIAVPIAMNRLLDKWGVEADAERRKALATAIVNGLIQALHTRGIKRDDLPAQEHKAAVINDAAEYAAKTVPGTIKKLGVPHENLAAIATAYLPQVLGAFGPVGAVIGTIGAAALDAIDHQPERPGTR